MAIAAVILFGLIIIDFPALSANNQNSAINESSTAEFLSIEEKLLREGSYAYSYGYRFFDQTDSLDEGFGGGELTGNVLVQETAFLSPNNPSAMNLLTGNGLFDRQRSGIVTYEVQIGDTPSYIAASFGISTETLLGANKLNYLSLIRPGDKFVILPVSGALHEVKKGEVLADIVKKYKGDTAETTAYNGLPADGSLAVGQKIIIPGGTPQIYQATPKAKYAYVASYIGPYGSKSHQFPWGQCTWYIAQKRYIPWGGNAKSWLNNAKAFGFQTGTEPQVGAIVATNETWYGHVAYVEEVSADYIIVSEMSLGRGILNKRNIPTNSRKIKGYIY